MILQTIEAFFNNQSVGAFLGAFSAFLLVMLNDWRRDRRKVRNIRAEVEANLSHAKGKLESVRIKRTMMREQNRVMPAPILRFNTVLIRQLSAEVLDRLTLDQRRALEGLCYTMEAIDGLLDEAFRQTKLLFEESQPKERMEMAQRLLVDFHDAIANLKRLIEMCEHYVAGRYEVIVTKQYDPADYDEP